MVIRIEHFGAAFISNANAVLLATGAVHHIVLLRR